MFVKKYPKVCNIQKLPYIMFGSRTTCIDYSVHITIYTNYELRAKLANNDIYQIDTS